MCPTHGQHMWTDCWWPARPHAEMRRDAKCKLWCQTCCGRGKIWHLRRKRTKIKPVLMPRVVIFEMLIEGAESQFLAPVHVESGRPTRRCTPRPPHSLQQDKRSARLVSSCALRNERVPWFLFPEHKFIIYWVVQSDHKASKHTKPCEGQTGEGLSDDCGRHLVKDQVTSEGSNRFLGSQLSGHSVIAFRCGSKILKCH